MKLILICILMCVTVVVPVKAQKSYMVEAEDFRIKGAGSSRSLRDNKSPITRYYA